MLDERLRKILTSSWVRHAIILANVCEADEDSLSAMCDEVALLEAVMEATNPWIATMAIPNCYDCHYCRGFIRYVGVPRREMKEGHQEDCVFLKALKAGEVGG